MSNNTPTTATLFYCAHSQPFCPALLGYTPIFLTRRKPADNVTTGLAGSTNRRLKRNGGQNY